MGRDLVQKKAEERWGAGVVEQVSLDLRREFPNETGFSARNLWYMKQWYLFYISEGEDSFLHQVGAEMQKLENQHSVKLHQLGAEIDGTKLYQIGREFPLPFAFVPWKHHVEIITRCETVEKALFYVGKTIEQGLSRVRRRDRPSSYTMCVFYTIFPEQLHDNCEKSYTFAGETTE